MKFNLKLKNRIVPNQSHSETEAESAHFWHTINQKIGTTRERVLAELSFALLTVL